MCRSTPVVVGEVQDEATESVHQEAGDRQQPLRVRAGTPESKPFQLNTFLNKKDFNFGASLKQASSLLTLLLIFMQKHIYKRPWP